MREETKEIFDRGEQYCHALRALYARYGYLPYKMSRFEEYDLYGRNKDFLVSDRVLTFTDTDGKLMALKPDVTLSIVKHFEEAPGALEKVSYSECVYRAGRGGGFREIQQTGLECIGQVGRIEVGEALYLAAQSLKECAAQPILAASDLDLTEKAVRSVSPDPEVQNALFSCAGDRKIYGIDEICRAESIDPQKAWFLKTLLSLYGTPEKVFPELLAASEKAGALREAEEFRKTLSVFGETEEKDCLRVDFSVVNDRKYYSGIVFSGFVPGVPESVLSGGRYDPLLRRMGKNAGAVGFAVYVDRLERLWQEKKEYDVDVVFLYEDDDDPAQILRSVRQIRAQGKSVRVCRNDPGKIRAKTVIIAREGQEEIHEEDA